MKNDSASKKVVIVSGGFDPLHIGHVRLFEAAKELGDELVVVLNNDVWLEDKKGAPFMPEQERKEIIEALRCVDRVVLTSHNPDDPDRKTNYARWRSICDTMSQIKPDIFAQGGDRNEKDAADPNSSAYYEHILCKEMGCEMVFSVGRGGKVQSSSWLTDNAAKRAKTAA
jgi:D-beta-D-heptose 7-phosphate kinase/D-beta-D-heptose 1-phosphate adenosyltransferase